MIWPFKREPAMSEEEFAAQFAPAPCGEQTKHYVWEKLNSLPCPVCSAREKRRAKDEELDRLADKIVARLRSKEQS